MTTPTTRRQRASSASSVPPAQAETQRKAYNRRNTRAKLKSDGLRQQEAAHVEALPVQHPHAAGIDIGSRDKGCKASEAEIAQALTGTYREEHLFELKLAYEAWQFTLGQVQKVDAQIALQLGRMKGDRAAADLADRRRRHVVQRANGLRSHFLRRGVVADFRPVRGNAVHVVRHPRGILAGLLGQCPSSRGASLWAQVEVSIPARRA